MEAEEINNEINNTCQLMSFTAGKLESISNLMKEYDTHSNTELRINLTRKHLRYSEEYFKLILKYAQLLRKQAYKIHKSNKELEKELELVLKTNTTVSDIDQLLKDVLDKSLLLEDNKEDE